MDTNELIYKQKQTHRLGEWIYSSQEGSMSGRDRARVWGWHAHTAVFKRDNQQGLLHSPGKPAQYSVIT